MTTRVFETKTIQEVTETLIDYRGKTPEKTTNGVKLITAKVIKDGCILNRQHEYIAEDAYDSWMRRGLPKQWDILITTEAPLGEVAQLRTSEKIALAQRVILLRGNPNLIDQGYFFQALKSSFVKGELNARATGTTVLGIKQTELRLVRIPYYPLPIQRKIAGILSAYDRLIENNTRRIEILEEMARSIYREWFVKFRFPGHEQVQMVDSELGLIPEGWEVVKIGDVAEVGRGSSPRPIADQKYFEGGTIPWIKIADATKSGKYLYETKQKVNEYGASFSRLLPKGSLIIAASGTLGYTQLLGVDGCIHDGWLYLINFNGIEKEYLYYLFREQQQFFYNAAYGAAIQNVNTMILREMKIILPSSQSQKYFKDIIYNSDNLLDNLGRKNLNLRQTRDLLLPRLISGEIDVKNLDINTGEIAA